MILEANHFSEQKGNWLQTKTVVLQISTIETDENGNPASLEFLHQGIPGNYQIWLRYPNLPKDESTGETLATNVPIEIVHQRGTKRVVVNQNTGNGSTWRLLGQFELEPNSSKVRISNQEVDGIVAMGQLKFVQIDSGRAIPSSPPIVITADQYSDIKGKWSRKEEIVLSIDKTETDQTDKPASLDFDYRGATGKCQILLRYTIHPNDSQTPIYASNVPIEIIHRRGTTKSEINQQIPSSILHRANGDKWQEINLGIYELESGESKIRFSNKDTDGQVIVGELEYIYYPSVDHHYQLQGQLKEVRVWEQARSIEQIQNNRFELPAGDRNGLLFYWQTEQLPDSPQEHLLSDMQLPATTQSILSQPTLPLIDLAHAHQLLTETKLPLNRLSALWANLKHTGIGDNRTLFDDIFNPRGTVPDLINIGLMLCVYAGRQKQLVKIIMP